VSVVITREQNEAAYVHDTTPTVLTSSTSTMPIDIDLPAPVSASPVLSSNANTAHAVLTNSGSQSATAPVQLASAPTTPSTSLSARMHVAAPLEKMRALLFSNEKAKK